MTVHDLNLNITDFNPETGLVSGVSSDGAAVVLHLTEDDAEKLLAQLTNRGNCPRCDFENSISDLVYAAEFIQQHYAAEQTGQLSDTEIQLVDACRSWLANDAIERCLEEADGCG